MDPSKTSIHYTVSMPREHARHFHVEIQADTRGLQALEFQMPVWTPGSYSVMDYAGKVHSIGARGDSGETLVVEKQDKTSWRVQTRGERGIRLQYLVRAFDISVDRSYVDGERATINGASLFMYVAGRKEEPVTATFQKPGRWRIYTGLKLLSRTHNQYFAEDYDELLDCPVMMGDFDVRTFKVRGIEHRIVIVGSGNYDVEELVLDTARLSEKTIEIFGDIPYGDYTFFMEMAPKNDGGLEHRNSTHMIFDRWGFKPRDEYVESLLLISHEFIHTWNVKRLKPAGLGPFDYSREVYSPLLWFSEGFTSYYEGLILRRAGCISAREYLDEVGRAIRRLQMTPGRKLMTLEESSLDTWTKFYHPHPDSPNMSISYYNKGALFGLALDLEIRQRTEGESSLDVLMRTLYRRFYQEDPRGFTFDDVLEVARELGGPSIPRLFESVVQSTREINWNRYLGHVGLETENLPRSELEVRKKKLPRPQAYLGLRVRNQGGNLFVNQVLSDGPCQLVPIHPEDELIALDGVRLDDQKLDKLMELVRPEAELKFVISRGGDLKEVLVKPFRRPPIDIAIQPRKKATTLQKCLYEGWVRDSWDSLSRTRKPVSFRPREKVI